MCTEKLVMSIHCFVVIADGGCIEFVVASEVSSIDIVIRRFASIDIPFCC